MGASATWLELIRYYLPDAESESETAEQLVSRYRTAQLEVEEIWSWDIGTRWPLHATSTGKAWLAFDEFGVERLGSSMDALTQNTVTSREDFAAQFVEIRKRGYAISVDELEEGFTAVATIFRGVLGDVQGAISIGGPTQRFSMVRCAEFGTALRRAAQRLTPEI